MIGVDEFVTNLKESLVNLGTQAVMSYLSVQVPVLAKIPLVPKIIEYLTKKFLSFVTNSLELGAYYAYIENHTRKQAEDYAAATLAYHQAKGTADAEAKKQALIEAARKLISLRQ